MAVRDRWDLEWGTYGDSFANRLVTIRQHRGLTQEQVAERTGMHRNQMSNMERNVSSGERFADPHLSTIFRLAMALDVPPEFLIPDLGAKVRRRSPEQASAASMSRVEAELRRLLDDNG